MADVNVKEITGIAKDVAAVIGFLSGAMYFFWRVFFQKSFQRLSADVNVTPLGPNSWQRRSVVLDCKIENKADTRINLEWLRYRMTVDDVETAEEKFPCNISRAGSPESYSIDAQSSVHFCKQVELHPDAQTIFVTVTFRPKLTGETYTVQKAVVIG